MELKQSVINIILITTFSLLSFLVFIQKQYSIKSDVVVENRELPTTAAAQSIKETDLFGREKPHEKIIEVNEFSEARQISAKAMPAAALSQTTGTSFSPAALKEILFYSSSPNIPEQFIGKKTNNKELTEFSIEQIQSNRILKKQNNKETKKQTNKTTKKEGQLNTAHAKKEVKNELDFSILNKAIEDSKLTFFYPYNFKTFNDVSVGILSVTPYKDNQHIIKFEIKNNTPNFFIIANISVKNAGNQILIRKFFANVVGKKTDKQGILLTPQFKSGDIVSLTFLENGGRNRTYLLEIKIP
jgi:hypothetical protein